MKSNQNSRLMPSIVIGILWFMILKVSIIPLDLAPTYYDLFELAWYDELGTGWQVLLGLPTASVMLLSALHLGYGRFESISKGYVTAASIFTILVFLIYFFMFSMSASLLEFIAELILGSKVPGISAGPTPVIYLVLSIIYLVLHSRDKSHLAHQYEYRDYYPDPKERYSDSEGYL